jgi:hypothetical protein
MPVYKLSPIDSRGDDPKWAASTLKEAVWVDAPDGLAARHLVEGATLKVMDFRPGQKLLFSPWLDEVVTTCWPEHEVQAPPAGTLLTAGGKTVKLALDCTNGGRR